MEVQPRPALVALGALAVVVAAYPFLPLGETASSVVYDLIAIAAIAVAIWGVAHHRPARSGGWLLVIGGFAAWVIGDLEFSLEQYHWQLTTYPLPSDAIYIGAYGLLAVGVLKMVRTRGAGRDITALLDAAIVATGSAVVAAVFLIAPLAEDTGLTAFGKVISSAYPVMDVLLIAVIVRMWAAPGARTASYRLLVSSLLASLTGDVMLNVSMVVSGALQDRWSTSMYLLSYVLIATAACVPSMTSVTRAAPDRIGAARSGRRLVVLAGGLMLPALTLLVQGATGAPVLWHVIGVGMLAISALVLARMAGVLRVVEAQAEALTDLARLDDLTGLPNRRTWDFELVRACAESVANGTPLSVAIIDLDHFKSFNDSRGHQAGDDLLRAAAAAWTERLGDGAFLARYGGDEFTVLLPGLTAAQAQGRIDGLRGVTPYAQTVSAGVTQWDPRTGPDSAVAGADRALYAAKQLGRDRVQAFDGTSVGASVGERAVPA